MRRVRRPLIALIALIVAAAIGYAVKAASSDDQPHRAPSSTAATTSTGALTPLSSLPSQARETVELIRRGGPFPYPRNDGVVFHNNEHRLPAEPDGWDGLSAGRAVRGGAGNWDLWSRARVVRPCPVGARERTMEVVGPAESCAGDGGGVRRWSTPAPAR